jgi:DNA-binding response OmpR family regulator
MELMGRVVKVPPGRRSENVLALMNPRILFVDDEANMRGLLSLYLRKQGMEVTVVATGPQAMESFSRTPFDLAILDLHLAGGDCLEVFNYIKRRNAAHPVIIFTGVTDDELFVKRALLGRASAVVRKMSSLAGLLAEIQRCLPKNPAAEATRSELVRAPEIEALSGEATVPGQPRWDDLEGLPTEHESLQPAEY